MQELISQLERIQVSVAVIGLVLLFLIETGQPFLKFFTSGFKERAQHSLANLALGAINGIINAVLFTALWLWAATYAEQNNFGLLHYLSTLEWFPNWGRIIVAVLIFDFWMYLWHRINHEVPLFWRFHRVHHADAKMDVTTATRFHFGEIILSSIIRIPIIILLGLQLWELLVYGVVVAVVVQFHHANIALPEWLDKTLRTFIVTPHIHKVHHSRWQPETDSNYGTIFSFWDRLMRTFRLHNPLHTLELGLDEFDTEEDKKIKGMLSMPFRKGVKKSK